MMKGKCNCGKKAVAEYLITNHRSKTVWSMIYCDACKPKYTSPDIQLIYGK